VDIVAFSHLRWGFVFQRPQHLLTRAAKGGRVLFLEEEERAAGPPRLVLTNPKPNITVARPVVPDELTPAATVEVVRSLAERMVAEWHDGPYVLWHYSVMAEPLSRNLGPFATIFDCMDDLTAFRFAPRQLLVREAALLARADLVFTGGWTLYQAKRHLHPRVFPFPSSIDTVHFGRARHEIPEPPELAPIGHPRFVYAGVIDERLDLSLVSHVAAAGIGEVVLIGPVAKLADQELPRAAGIHYLGMRDYQELPAFFAHCDVGIMPFALNDATRSISPTKTPEYLAAGLPVVTTPIADVVRSYGDLATVRVARSRRGFIAGCLDALCGPRIDAATDARLAESSWDRTWHSMAELIEAIRTPSDRPWPAAQPVMEHAS
jgi:glycosyltransferase involved in cell wall biosynthesis